MNEQQDINTMTREQMQAEIARLKGQMAGLPRSLSCKVTEKGGLSVYGLGRFPVTLYRSQWEKLLKFANVIEQEIKTLPEKTA